VLRRARPALVGAVGNSVRFGSPSAVVQALVREAGRVGALGGGSQSARATGRAMPSPSRPRIAAGEGANSSQAGAVERRRRPHRDSRWAP